jgi:ABC-type antimicrobial peptide transport system permease subunit
MASVVIVANQCYLLAEAINYMVINECDDSDDRSWHPTTPKARKMYRDRKKRDKYEVMYRNERKPYQIIINFIPKGAASMQNNTNSLSKKSDDTTVTIRVHGLQPTISLFQDIVSQIRDQIPDELFLDRLVQNFLTTVVEEEAEEKG